MPAIDFTPYVTTWLANGREAAIEELWGYLTYSGEASRFALKKALKVSLPSWIQLSDTARHELHAIYILTMRAVMSGKPQSMDFVGGWLFAMSIGCRQLSLPPDYDRSGWTAAMTRATNSMVIAPAYSDDLLKFVRSETETNSLLGSVHGKNEGARLAMEKALSPLGALEAVTEKLKAIPPMARFVVYDYVSRSWGYGTLRFDLYYDQREYGCGSEANQQYVEWLGFFGLPSDQATVPAAVTKDVLREALAKQGIEIKKSGTKKEMIEKAQGIPGLLSSLIVQVYPQQRELLPEWKGLVNDWALRVRYVEAVGRALFKIMALKGMSNSATTNRSSI